MDAGPAPGMTGWGQYVIRFVTWYQIGIFMMSW
jgi:hypothetical protein